MSNKFAPRVWPEMPLRNRLIVMENVYTVCATGDQRNCDATTFEQALTKVKNELAKAESIAESIDGTKAAGWSLVYTCIFHVDVVCVVCISSMSSASSAFSMSSVSSAPSASSVSSV